MIDQDTRRMIIIDHYERPRNHKLIEDIMCKQKHSASDSCIDDFTMQIKVEDDIVKEANFISHGCALSTSSTSIITTMIKGKSKEEALKIIDNYLAMVQGQDYDKEDLEELEVFDNVYKQANRINCACIGPKAFKELLENE